MPSIAALFVSSAEVFEQADLSGEATCLSTRGRSRPSRRLSSGAFSDFSNRRRASSQDAFGTGPLTHPPSPSQALGLEAVPKPSLEEVLGAAVRPLQWSPAKTKAVLEKLMLAGVMSVDDFETAIADDGVELNSKLHALGLKALKKETIERFQSHLKREKSERLWRLALQSRRQHDHNLQKANDACLKAADIAHTDVGTVTTLDSRSSSAVSLSPSQACQDEAEGSEDSASFSLCQTPPESPSSRKVQLGSRSQVWDYPLSRSEKQLRLACLYENECHVLDEENRQLRRFIRRSSLSDKRAGRCSLP
eukprot:TRINITY_DN34247_c0_g1_i2.p1 TRINITY_DN34247_c0_g1~~TRINITY_DN34247_c0_g1_i2.p1  ORF type:complete len:307 (+),score=64.27 TRINITY_DN34247_c0_g1_i2:37-957(+)